MNPPRMVKSAVSFFLGLTVSGAALYFALRYVPISELLSYLKTIHWGWMFPAVFTIILSFVIRVMRWRIIVSAAHPIGFWQAFHPLMIGFMANCILPGRIGEVIRPALLRARHNLPFPTGLATIATERLFDLFFLIAAFSAVLSGIPQESIHPVTFHGITLSGATLMEIASGMRRLFILIAGGMAFFLIPAVRRGFGSWLQNLSRPPSARDPLRMRSLLQSVARFTANTASGFSLFTSPKKMTLCMGLSLLIWSLQAFSCYLLSLGCPGVSLSFPEMYAVLILICFFIMLPSVPGYWGVWEAGGVFAMSIFGVGVSEAAGFTLANHALQILPVILIGLYSMTSQGIRFSQFTGLPSNKGF